MSIKDSRMIIENTPWNLLTDERLDNEPYSGLLLKAFRVNEGKSLQMLGHCLGIKRVSAVRRLEAKERIGIKIAKKVATVFSIPNYRIFRSRTTLEEYKPSKEATEALTAAKEILEGQGILVLKLFHSLTDKGDEALVAQVQTRKRKFVEEINGIPLSVLVITRMK